MKATFDIPDEIYRRAKARSAIEGRPLRAVVMELFQAWLDREPEPAKADPPPATRAATRFDHAPWLKIARRHVKPGMSHDLDEICESAARGWAVEAAAKGK